MKTGMGSLGRSKRAACRGSCHQGTGAGRYNYISPDGRALEDSGWEIISKDDSDIAQIRLESG